MKFLEGLREKFNYIVVGALVIIALFAINKSRQLDKAKQEIAIVTANYNASQDQVRIQKAKNGVLEYQKRTYVARSIEELKKVNAALAAEVLATKGNVTQIQKTEYKIVHDTIEIKVKPEYRDGVVIVHAPHDTTYSEGNYRKLDVTTTIDSKDSSAITSINKDEIGFTAVTGVKKTEKGYEIFVRPKYPNMSVVELEGAILDKSIFASKQKKPPLITLGLNVGWMPMTYDLKDKIFSLKPSQLGGGLGANINLNRLLK